MYAERQFRLSIQGYTYMIYVLLIHIGMFQMKRKQSIKQVLDCNSNDLYKTDWSALTLPKYRIGTILFGYYYKQTPISRYISLFRIFLDFQYREGGVKSSVLLSALLAVSVHVILEEIEALFLQLKGNTNREKIYQIKFGYYLTFKVHFFNI